MASVVNFYRLFKNGIVSKDLRLVMLFGLCFWFCTSIIQAQTIQWEQNYGGSAYDDGLYVQQTNDGGYIVTGRTNSSDQDVSANNGDSDGWLVKLDGSGNILWENNYGGSAIDLFTVVQQTNDGGYIAAGRSESNDGDLTNNNGGMDYWVVKLDASGTIEWQQNYGGSNYDNAVHIQQTGDGGYIVGGNSTSGDQDVSGNYGNNDIWILKLDNAGNIEWKDNYGGSNTDNLASIRQTNDGGYIGFGSSYSSDEDLSGNYGENDLWVFKLDVSGNITWQQHYGGGGYQRGYSIRQTYDGGYIAAGYSDSADQDVSANNGSYDAWVLKLDGSGNIEWENNYGGSGIDYAFSVRQTTDTGYVVAGNAYSSDQDLSGNNGSSDAWVIRLDSLGNIEWQQNYGGSNFDDAYCIQKTNDGGYITAGRSESSDGDVSGNYGSQDFWVIKLGDALPVHFTGFSVEKRSSGKATLNWTTATEKNNAYFIVERSKNGETFTPAGRVPGNGTTRQKHTYTFTGDRLPAGKHYYRLKQVDDNGDYQYSSLRSVRINTEDRISVYPNPNNGTFNLNLNGADSYRIAVSNSTGHTVYQSKINSAKTTIDLGSVPEGMYIVRIQNGQQLITRKVIVK